MADKILNTVNQHCLDNIMRLTESRNVTTSEDIFDANGIKLLAKGADINLGIRERLLYHKLHKPLEGSLTVEDGVDQASVLAEANILLEEVPALKVFMNNEQASIFEILSLISFQPAATLLLTAAENNREGVFRHGVLVTLIAVSLGVQQKISQSELISLAMAGLLHDIGELYINPIYFDNKHPLNPEEWKHVVVHPRIGQLALSELTNYPKTMIEAVGNHHERLDGSGYPRQISGQQISPLSQVLSMAETLSGIITRKGDVLTRSCLALKCVPGEYPRDLISIVSTLRRNYSGAPLSADDNNAEHALSNTHETSRRLADAIFEAKQIALSDLLSPNARDLLHHTENRIVCLQRAMSATGMDDCNMDESMLASSQEGREVLLEIDVVGREIGWRMRDIARDLYIRLSNHVPEATHEFSRLIETLDNRKTAGAAPLQPSPALS